MSLLHVTKDIAEAPLWTVTGLDRGHIGHAVVVVVVKVCVRRVKYVSGRVQGPRHHQQGVVGRRYRAEQAGGRGHPAGPRTVSLTGVFCFINWCLFNQKNSVAVAVGIFAVYASVLLASLTIYFHLCAIAILILTQVALSYYSKYHGTIRMLKRQWRFCLMTQLNSTCF